MTRTNVTRPRSTEVDADTHRDRLTKSLDEAMQIRTHLAPSINALNQLGAYVNDMNQLINNLTANIDAMAHVLKYADDQTERAHAAEKEAAELRREVTRRAMKAR